MTNFFRNISLLGWALFGVGIIIFLLMKTCGTQPQNVEVTRTDTSYVKHIPIKKLEQPGGPIVMDKVIIEVKPDTLLRKQVQSKTILLSASQSEKKRFLRKPQYVVTLQSIDPLGIKTESVKTFDLPQQLLITPDGLQTEPIKKKGKGIKWVIIGLTFIAGVATGIAAN